MFLSFLHFHCYFTWDCISHVPHQVTNKHNTKARLTVEVSMGVIYLWKGKDGHLKLILHVITLVLPILNG